jgi:hypothetical protein
VEPEFGVVVDMEGMESLDRVTFNPALAIEVRLESGLDCFRKAAGSEELAVIGFNGAVKGLEIATGSLFDCINAAMGNGSFTLPR